MVEFLKVFFSYLKSLKRFQSVVFKNSSLKKHIKLKSISVEFILLEIIIHSLKERQAGKNFNFPAHELNISTISILSQKNHQVPTSAKEELRHYQQAQSESHKRMSRDAWVPQSVKHLTLDLSSGHDLSHESEPCMRRVRLRFLPLLLRLARACAHSLSLSLCLSK